MMMVGQLSSHFRALEFVDAAIESFVSAPPVVSAKENG